jgi:hypothetical protein
MTNALSLPPADDLDTQMRKVARELAMGIYELDTILDQNEVDEYTFHRFKEHPRFLEYLKQEREAWNAASNVSERTKLKAGIIMEEFMIDAAKDLIDKKTPLNQRVELAKLLAKVAGMGEARTPIGGGVGGFQLNINIGPGVAPVVIKPTFAQTIEHDNDDYDPFTSPTTLED